MLLTSDTPSTATRLTRNDAVFLLVLSMTLVLAGSSFFAPFSVLALLAGLLLSLALHRYSGRTEATTNSLVTPDHLAGINIAAIRVGADAGGLIFVVGSVAIVLLGVPALRWFLLASLLAAGALAMILIARRVGP